MRSSSLARVVMVSLGVSVVITLGCGQSPPWEPPSPTKLWNPVQRAFSVHGISPTLGPVTSSAGATVATIAGTGFQSGAIVTVDGSRVDATVLSLFAISLAMPAHAAGTANVTVINPLSQAQASVPGGYTYVGAPVISELRPNIGSTGGVPIIITGTGMGFHVTVTVDGIVSTFEYSWDDDAIFLSMPAHAAGTVEVIVTDRYGQAGKSEFTYASPATFDFNGDWQGWAEDYVLRESRRLQLTIRDNTVVSVSCDSAPSLTLDPPPVVANGEFSFAGSDGVSITGRILSPNSASGSIDMASCGSRRWSAEKKQ
jgi:IPT/TIG domain